jgi:trimethylamine---corrinoid protein Co-methyltransferase
MMNSGFQTQCRPSYRLLTEAQIREIHLASLEVLETIGVRLLHDGAVQLLQEAGCRVKSGNIVRIPNWLVDECIRTAPSRLTIYDREGQEAMRLEGRKIHFGLGTDLIKTQDLETGQIRPTRLQDVIHAARVADACPEIDFVASFGLPGDVPTNYMYVACARAMIENATKPIFFTAGGQEDLAIIFEMAATVTGGVEALRERPFLIHYSEPTAPLSHSHNAIDKLFFCAERGLPICYTPGDILGASTPVTLAGGIVQATAEALSGLVLHQVKAKGAPIISGFVLAPLDMKKGTICYGAPEFRLTNSAFADIFHHYGLPIWSTVGSDAQSLDGQAAMEHAWGALLAALDGANLIHDVGYLGQGLVSNPAAIVMCNEIIGYVKRVIRGLDLSPEKIGLEVIRQVGPGGHYLTQAHTKAHFSAELWAPQLLNRDSPDSWAKRGSPRYEEIVTRRAQEILACHRGRPLPTELGLQIEAIARRAEEALAGVQFVS